MGDGEVYDGERKVVESCDPIPKGGSRTYRFVTDSEHFVSSVTVGDSRLGAISSYSFSNVTQNWHVQIYFGIRYFVGGNDNNDSPISVVASEGGAVKKSEPVDGVSRLTFAPEDGYAIGSVTVNGNPVLPTAILKLSDEERKKVEVSFKKCEGMKTTVSEDGTVSMKLNREFENIKANYDAVYRPDGTYKVEAVMKDTSAGVSVSLTGNERGQKVFMNGIKATMRDSGILFGPVKSSPLYEVNAESAAIALQLAEKMRDIAGDMGTKSPAVILDIATGGEGSDRSAVLINKETMAGFESIGCSIEIVTSMAKTCFDSVAVAFFAHMGDAVTVFTAKIDPKSLDASVATALGKRILRVGVKIGDTKYDTITGTMTLHVFTGQESCQDATVVIMDNGGSMQEIKASYDAGAKEVKFSTDKMTYYGVMAGTEEPKVGTDYSWIVALVMVLTAVAVIMGVYRYKSSPKVS